MPTSANSQTPPPVESRTVIANGLRQHYLVCGEGTPLLLLHGWPETSLAWRALMPALADAGRAVIAPDLRGTGLSGKPTTGYEKATMAQDVHALMGALGHDSYAVAGHDIGGMVAFAAAVQFPDAVSALVLIDIPLPGLGPWDRMLGSPALWHFGFHAQRDLAESLISGREATYVGHFIRERAARPGAIPDERIAAYAEAMAYPGALRGGLEWYRTFEADAAFNKLAAEKGKLSMPVRGLAGERLAPALEATLGAVATDASVKVATDCGHWIPEERPDLVIDLIDGI